MIAISLEILNLNFVVGRRRKRQLFFILLLKTIVFREVLSEWKSQDHPHVIRIFNFLSERKSCAKIQLEKLTAEKFIFDL